MRGNKEVFSVPVVFADRFFMSEKSLAEISLLGGCAWADARDHLELAKQLGGSSSVRILVSEYIAINALVMERAPSLKGIIAYGAGYDHIDVKQAAQRGVLVCNCQGANAQAVAELTFGLLLCLMRKIHLSDRLVREDGWKKAESANLPAWVMGEELQGKTLGIIGLGQIGSRVARIARGFDMKILAYDPFVQLSLSEVESSSLEDILSQADIVTLHVPLAPTTEKMINAQTVAMMKPKALLVNTSRGKVIDEPVLLEALKEKRIAGAALDVFGVEPISGDHPLAKLHNVVLSPHIGALSQEAGERLSDAVARQIRDILEGRKPECLISS
ncbi:MAG: hydroxyacid dehydrogenase [Deltaproteobacteria bacterium]|nr:hydroxyacid dehydrogenase [Deltaproteobacteria bacterium]